MAITDLHARFIDFAGGMPALALSREQLRRELLALTNQLSGTYPDRPAPSMGNIPMPDYGLAYSTFVTNVQIRMSSSYAELSADITATIHPRGRPADIVREYAIETTPTLPVQLVMDYDQAVRKLFWREQGVAVPNMTAQWGPDADAVLATTRMASPQKDTFLKEVEAPSIFTTKNMFVSLLIALLPSYDTGAIAPWLTLLDPLRFSYSGDHIIITASRAQIAVGGCNPKSVTVEPDPNFPYGQPIPAPALSAVRVDVAVYLPKTRFIDFTAAVLEPAVLVSTGGGGLIKWAANGAFGLNAITADITTGIHYGNSSLTVIGNIGLAAAVDFVGAARAWIDGPSGLRIGLASASVIGRGEFGAEIRLTVDLTAGYLYGDLVVTKSELPDVDFDVNLPWPINEVADLILDAIAKNEIKKLTGQMTHLGRWDFMGIPLSYMSTIDPRETVVPITEGLAGVAAYTAIGRGEGRGGNARS